MIRITSAAKGKTLDCKGNKAAEGGREEGRREGERKGGGREGGREGEGLGGEGGSEKR